MLEIKNAYKIFNLNKKNELIALNNVNISLPNTGLFFVLGKSGSGKSTLLKIIGGLDKLSKGTISFNNYDYHNDYDAYRNSIVGYVFQDYNLINNMNVKNNLDYVLRLNGIKDNNKIKEILKVVNLDNYENRKVNELSGGEQQRVAIARALIKNPKIILADEPTGNLDNKNSKIIFDILKKLSKNSLIIVATHDITSAEKYGDGIIKMDDGNAKFLKKEILSKSICYRKPKFIGVGNSLKLSINFSKSSLLISFFAILLLSISFTLLNISNIINNVDIDDVHASNILASKNKEILISRNNNFDSELTLFENDLKYLDSILDSNKIIKTKYFYDNKEMSMTKIYLDSNSNTENKYNNSYYQQSLNYQINYIENTNLSEEDLVIGYKSTRAHEVVITEYLADYYIAFGVKLFKINELNGTFEEEYYKPKTYEDLMNKKLYLYNENNGYFIITGIKKNYNETFNKFKEIPISIAKRENTQEYIEFLNDFKKNINNFYISNNFFDDFIMEEYISNNRGYYDISLLHNNKELNPWITDSFGYYLQENIDSWNSNQTGISLKNPSKGNVILSYSMFINNEDFLKYYNEQSKNLIFNDYEEELDYKNSILNQYVKNNLIGEKIDIVFYNKYISKESESYKIIFKDMIIEDFTSLSGISIVMNKEDLNPILEKTVGIYNINYYPTNKDEIVKLLNDDIIKMVKVRK